MTSVIIREATSKDASGIWRVFQEVVRTGDTYAYDPGIAKKEAIASWMAPDHAVFVAEDNRAVVGTYFLAPNQPGLGSHISNAAFMVYPGYQAKGVGKLMANHALEEAKSRGYRGMQFNLVVSTNQTAVRLWRKLGFVIIGTVPEAFNHSERGLVDAYIMYKKLD